MLSNKSLVRIWTKLTIALIAALKQRNILRDLIGCGFLVETGKFEDLFSNERHRPYQYLFIETKIQFKKSLNKQ